MENEVMDVLSDIIDKILASSICRKELKELIISELESRNIWESDNLLVTDCYYALKHMEEEQISVKEWMYFQECFHGKREYNLKDKFLFTSE